jgi:hypothetical protein
MEFFEDNPNFEINLQTFEENRKTNKKTLKAIRNSGIKANKISSNNSPVKDNNQNILMNNMSIKTQKINLINTPNQKENKEISSENSINQSQEKSNNSSKISNLLKIKKTQKINNLLKELKSKNNYHLSPNTNLKLYGDLFPGPGQYYNPQAKIGQNQNFRYNNLYIKDTEPSISLKYKKIKDFYYNSKVGPGTYDPNDNIVYKSYSQNPKIFISKLERGPLFKINDTIGPGQYNLIKDYNKDIKCNSSNQFKKRTINVNIGTQFPENNYHIFNTFNNNNYDNILNSKNNIYNDIDLNNSLNKSIDRSDEKKNRNTSGKYYKKGHKNFSWRGTPDFSGVTIKYDGKENKNFIQNDFINYKKQNFNFENQYKLNQLKNIFSTEAEKKIQKEISSYNKLNMPLIQNVQRDLSLKGNHIPGPCYYKYSNDSIEGDMINLNKRIKKSSYKKWK